MPSSVTVDFLNNYHKNATRQSNRFAYLAGLIDGEGYVKIEKWGTIRLVIGMTARKVIYWLKSEFGGSVKADQITTGNKTFYVWRLGKPLDVLKLMIMVYPHLIFKKNKVLKAMDLLRNRMAKHKQFSPFTGLEFN